MRITFLSDARSWKNDSISEMAKRLRKKKHAVACLHRAEAVQKGDILFILGFFKIVAVEILKRNKTNIVVHESALPKGRGMSPVTWQVIEGEAEIPMTLFEAVEKVDAGKVFGRGKVVLAGNELLREIQQKVAGEMVRLCEEFVARYPVVLKSATKQEGPSTYYRRRKPEDSRLDPEKSLANQFNLLRTVDNDTYPAFFDYRGGTYILRIEKKL